MPVVDCARWTTTLTASYLAITAALIATLGNSVPGGGWLIVAHLTLSGALLILNRARPSAGITRAGNKHVRRLMVQLAWSWRRYQPTSTLTRWYEAKFGRGSRRLRRIGIVAVARKLLIALWRYVEHGVIPDGAIVKGQVA
jgi:hypothetical protein